MGHGMTFEAYAAILLTAVAVVVAVLGTAAAVLAFWGYGQMKRDSVAAAEQAGTKEVKEQISSGPLRDYIHEEIDKIIKEEINSARMERRIRDRVAEIALGKLNKDDELDQDPENEGWTNA